MAKVKMPLMSDNVSGKFGDIVFQQRYGKTIARRRTIPANPNTMKQQIVRHDLGALSVAWKGTNTTLKKYDPATQTATDVTFNGLTEAEKTAWNQFATTQKKPSAFGRLLFVGRNIKRLMENQDPVRMP